MPAIIAPGAGLNGDVCHWKLLHLSLLSTSYQIYTLREEISMQRDWNDLDKSLGLGDEGVAQEGKI